MVIHSPSPHGFCRSRYTPVHNCVCRENKQAPEEVARKSVLWGCCKPGPHLQYSKPMLLEQQLPPKCGQPRQVRHHSPFPPPTKLYMHWHNPSVGTEGAFDTIGLEVLMQVSVLTEVNIKRLHTSFLKEARVKGNSSGGIYLDHFVCVWSTGRVLLVTPAIQCINKAGKMIKETCSKV